MDVKERIVSGTCEYRDFMIFQGMVGLAGLEPATPRLSSVCSNQLSYRPSGSPSDQCFEWSSGGGMRIRTADILLAKQTLYQLSYTP